MDLFFFLMILLSIIIGLGISEILTGFARVLRTDRLHQLILPQGALTITIFLALLQVFWETWGLRVITPWTFPAMVLMLVVPTLLHLIAHLIYPTDHEDINLGDHYYSKSRLIWSLVCLTVVVGTLFRPLAFDMPLLVVDNLSSIPTFLFSLLLAISNNKSLHKILVPIGALIVAVDTLVISYFIQV